MRAVATFLPLLVAVRLRYPDDAGKYAELVHFCERYAFRVYRLRAPCAGGAPSGGFVFWVISAFSTALLGNLP